MTKEVFGSILKLVDEDTDIDTLHEAFFHVAPHDSHKVLLRIDCFTGWSAIADGDKIMGKRSIRPIRILLWLELNIIVIIPSHISPQIYSEEPS